jgi:hypothetical protein
MSISALSQGPWTMNYRAASNRTNITLTGSCKMIIIYEDNHLLPSCKKIPQGR